MSVVIFLNYFFAQMTKWPSLVEGSICFLTIFCCPCELINANQQDYPSWKPSQLIKKNYLTFHVHEVSIR